MGVSGTKASSELARLEPVKLREVWPNEAADFTPWLAEPDNLKLLGGTLDIGLEDPQTEEDVGRFFADIVAKNTEDGRPVVIENQLDKTDHSHLGQILTYAAGLDALTVVWIAERFTGEHRAALEWLNNHTSEEIGFFGVEIEVWKIGDSRCAPKFNIVVKPNEWTKPRPNPEKLSTTRQAQLDFWRGFSDYASTHAKRITPTAARPQYRMGMSIGNGFSLSAVASTWEDDGRPGIRAEFVLSGKKAAQRFVSLSREREKIETELSGKPEWYSPKGVQHRKVIFRKSVDWQVPEERTDCYRWLVRNLDRLHEVFQPRIQKLG